MKPLAASIWPRSLQGAGEEKETWENLTSSVFWDLARVELAVTVATPLRTFHFRNISSEPLANHEGAGCSGAGPRMEQVGSLWEGPATAQTRPFFSLNSPSVRLEVGERNESIAAGPPKTAPHHQRRLIESRFRAAVSGRLGAGTL